jgi:DNA-binding SARP family transcriptional activator
MEFRLLGPLEVSDSGRLVPLGGANQRALLALLLLNANRVVSLDHIVYDLWGDSPPEDAARRVQLYAGNLRKVLSPSRATGGESGVLLTRPPGYMLRVQPEALDLLHFEELTREARRVLAADATTASALLREALALWQGPPLAGVVFEGSGRGEITRLKELHLSALEDRIECDLELGRHESLLEELQALVDANPTRQRLHAQLMLALYRCGRPSEALKVYRDTRRMLVEDFGIDPSAELQTLERAIRKQDPTLDAPPAPGQTGADQPLLPRPRRLLVAGALILILTAFGLISLLPRRGESSVISTPSPTTSPSATSTPLPVPFPTAAETQLLARFPAFVQSNKCHRALIHYPKAIAEVECPVSSDHPGATSILFQQFSNYPDMELHYHHVLGLTIQAESAKPLSSVAHGSCTSPDFFAVSTFGPPNTGGLPPGPHAQDSASSPLAYGHLVCYVDHAGKPHIAWTNVGWLIVAQATGSGTGSAGQDGLLASWQYDGPVGPAIPITPAPTLQAQVTYLYERYLLREPESQAVITYYSDFIQARGFTAAANEFANSAEGLRLINTGVVLPGH